MTAKASLPILVSFLLAAAPGPAAAEVRYVVEPSVALGPPAAPYTTPQTAAATIADAMAVSVAGDTILVAGGAPSPLEYVERVTLTSGVALLGGFDLAGTPFAARDPDSTVSMIRAPAGNPGTVVTIPAGAGRSTVLDGFQIRNGAALTGGGLLAVGASPTIRGNVFYLNESTSLTAGGGGAIRLENGSNALIIGNSFIRNTSRPQSGAVDLVASSPEIVNNIFFQDLVGVGIRCDALSAPSIRFNDFFRNPSGVTAGACSASVDSGNLFIDPLLCDVDGEVFTLFQESRLFGAGEGGADIGATGAGCRARVKFVAPNAGDDYPYGTPEGAALRIADALAIAGPGDTVKVADGVFEGAISIPAGVVVQGSWNNIFTARRVFGAFSALASDATGLGPIVSFVDDGGVPATLDGFVVTGGRANEGSAIRVTNSSPVLRGLSVLLNVCADSLGGAIHVDGGSPEIANTLFAINRGAGVSCAGGATPNIHHCGFFGNSGGETAGCPGPLPPDVLTEDPFFCDAGACSVVGDSVNCEFEDGDFHLFEESRYIGAADDGGLIGNITAACNVEFHYVSPSGGNRYPYTTVADAATSIAAAIAVASPFDEVKVAEGAYVESIDLGPAIRVTGGWDAAFVARDPAARITTILGNAPNTATVLAQGGLVDELTRLDGFTITHDVGVDGPGVEIRSGASPTIVGNLITGNTTAADAAGILVDGAFPTISNNTVFQNLTTSGTPLRAGGILVRNIPSGSPLSVTRNILYDNDGGYGIGCDLLVPGFSQNLSSANEGVPGSGEDPNVYGECPSGTVTSDPLFCDYAAGDLTLRFNSPARISDCGQTVMGARGVGCIDPVLPHTWHVKSGSPTPRYPYGAASCAATRISDVMPLVRPGDAVRIALGTYRETLTILPRVTYQGNFNDDFSNRNAETTLNGGGSERVLTIPPGIDTTTVIDGFSFTNGSADSGGGLYVSAGSSPIVRNVRFTFHRADSAGAAIYCAPGSAPKIRFCYFNKNRVPVPVSPVVTLDGSDAEVSNCTFFDNLTIGIDIVSGSPQVFNNILFRNDRGGIRCGAGATPDLGQNNAFSNDDFQYSLCSDSLLAFNISEDPLFCSLDSRALPLFDHSPSAGTGRGGLNMGAFPIGCRTTRHFVSLAGTPRFPYTCPDSSTSSLSEALALAGRNRLPSTSQDTVFVAAGVYNENITVPPNVILLGGYPPGFGGPAGCTNFSVSGRNPDLYPVIVRGTGAGSVATYLAGGNQDNSITDGFIFRGGNAARGGGIFVDRAAIFLMQNCTIDSCVASAEGGGVYVSPLATARLWFITAIHNQAPAGAAVFGDSAGANLRKWTVVENVAGLGGGAMHFRRFTGTMALALIAGNDGFGALGTNNTVLGGESRGNLFWDNTQGDTLGLVFPGNPILRFGNPQFCGADTGNYSVSYASPAVIGTSGCARPDINSGEVIGRYPVGCTGPGHKWLVQAGKTVAGSYPFACQATAARRLSEVLPFVNSRADTSDTVRVSGGRMLDNATLGKRAVILGGWNPAFTLRNPAANVTIMAPLDSTQGLLRVESAKDFDGVVIPESAIDTTSVIDGFTFELANSGLDNGGAISCLDASPRITNNTFRENRTQNFGGGVYALRSKDQAIRGNRFIENRAGHGGAIYLVDCESPTVSGNQIISNRADLRGAGIRLARHLGAAVIDNNTVVNNKGDGISFAGDDPAGSSAGEKSQIYNNVIAFNTLIGLERYPQSATDSMPAQDHNLHWGNRAGNFSGTAAGEGDVFLDPLFCFPDTNDFRLQACSPAVGGGRDSADSVIGHLGNAGTRCPDAVDPGISIAFLRNTIVPRFLDVYVTFTEIVVESTLTVLRICENQPSAPLETARREGAASVYGATGLETSNCGILTVQVDASDACGNAARFSRQVATALVSPGAAALLKGPDGAVRIEVGERHAGRETLLLIATAGSSVEDAGETAALASLGRPIGAPYEIVGAAEIAGGGADVSLRFGLPPEVRADDAGAVALYRRVGSGWVRVESALDVAARALVATSSGDGVHRLVLTGDRATSPALPRALALHPSAPNPAPGYALIAFDLPARGRATLRVYDVSGRRVATLVDETLPPGRHAFHWAGTDGAGRRLPSGVYFTELRSANATETRKLVLVR